MNSPKHKTVRVRVGSQDALIDKMIAPLVKEIWRTDIVTTMSCQRDRDGRIWLDFIDVSNGIRFLNAIARYEPGSGNLYARMTQFYSEDLPTWWWYQVFPLDLALHDEKPGKVSYDGTPDFCFTFTVRFPPADLPEVVRRMKQYNRKSCLGRKRKTIA